MKTFEDIAAVYRSEEDGVWIAHSVRTDQIGTGDRIVDALCDLIRAIDAVYKIAREDKSVAFFREAPKEIQRIARKTPNGFRLKYRSHVPDNYHAEFLTWLRHTHDG